MYLCGEQNGKIMEITFKGLYSIAEITVKSGNTTITEDIAAGARNIPESEIEQLLDVAYDVNRFNGKSEVDFLVKVFEHLQMSDGDKDEFMERVSKL